jgi:integrase
MWLAKRECKNSTYNKFSGFWKGLFKVATGDRMIAKADNPFDEVTTPWKNPKDTAKKRQIPTVEQFAAIVQSIRDETQNFYSEESANFVEFEGLAGLGQAEVAPMTWGRINWTEGRFEAWRAKTRTWFPVPIFPELRPLLEKLYKAAHDANGNPPKPDARIFTILDARKALTNACIRLGFPAFTQRELRSFHIVKQLRVGVDIKKIAKWQGHNDGGKLILNTYTEVSSADDDAYELKQLEKMAKSSVQKPESKRE